MQLPRKMSAHNVMMTISRTFGHRENKPSTANEIRFAGEERKDKLYEPKHKENLMRVLTVVAYVVFVSMAAILLSLYYTFIWNPKDQSIRMIRINKPECTKPPLDSLMISPILNETQIEKMTTRSTTMANKQMEEPNSSTTQRFKSLWEILRKTTDRTLEEMSSETSTSTSTTQDYHNIITNIASNENYINESDFALCIECDKQES